jgi:hypothetical protein
MAIIKKKKRANAGKDVEENKPHTRLVQIWIRAATMEISMEVP